MSPIDWDLITLPAADNEHTMNRLNAEQIAIVLPLIVERYRSTRADDRHAVHVGPALLPRGCERWEKLGPDGMITSTETYDVFSPVTNGRRHHR
jgi:hypothetical protein